MGASHFAMILICTATFLRSYATEATPTIAPPEKSENSTAVTNKSSIYPSEVYQTTENTNSLGFSIAYNDPFMLAGDDNILGPPRRRIARRLRTRRIGKLNLTNSASESVNNNTNSNTMMGTITTTKRSEIEVKGDSASFKDGVRIKGNSIGYSAYSDRIVKVTPPPPPALLLQSSYYTFQPRYRKKFNPSTRYWRIPNFAGSSSAQEFEETNKKKQNNVNINDNVNNNSSALIKTSTASTDLSPGRDIFKANNNRLAIATKFQNSLQFTLPLRNYEHILKKELKIPESETNFTSRHEFGDTMTDVPFTPDFRFVPTHLRKHHPLLNEDFFLTSQSSTKAEKNFVAEQNENVKYKEPFPRVSYSPIKTDLENYNTLRKNSLIPTSLRIQTVPSLISSISGNPPPIPPIKSTTDTSPMKHPIVNPAVQIEPIRNLKITEIVYPTVAKTNSDHTPNFTTHSTSTTTPIPTTSTTSATTTRTTVASTSTTVEFVTTTPTSTNTPTKSTETVKHIDMIVNPPSPPPILFLSSYSAVSKVNKNKKKIVAIPTSPQPSGTAEQSDATSPSVLTTTQVPNIVSSEPTTSAVITSTTPVPENATTSNIVPKDETPQVISDEIPEFLQLLNAGEEEINSPRTTHTLIPTTQVPVPTTTAENLQQNESILELEHLLSSNVKTLIKEAVDTGSIEKIKEITTKGDEVGLSDGDLKAIYVLLDAVSSTTLAPTTSTTTTQKPAFHPAIQGMLTMLNNPWSEVQKLRDQQSAQSVVTLPPLSFNIHVPSSRPAPVATPFSLLAQLFNLSPLKPQPSPSQSLKFGLSSLIENLLPKRAPSNNEVASSSNTLLSYLKPDLLLSTPPPGPYYWFDLNAVLGNKGNTAGRFTGFRPKLGSRDYFLNVRRRRNSMEIV